MTDRSHVVVVGGGLAGLFAAIEAADAGATTILLDARGRLGGRARTDQRDGARLNLGPHALYRAGAAQHHLDRLGITVTGRSPSTARTRFRTGDEVHRMPTTAQVTRFGRLYQRIHSGRRDPALDRLSLAEWMDAEGLGQVAAQGLQALVRTTSYVDAPDTFSAGAAFDQLHLGMRHGVRYLDGGWQTMVEALTRRARAAGVDVRTGARAVGVHPDGGGWVVEVADREADEDADVAAGAVVVAAGGPLLASRLLGIDDERWATPAVEVSVLDVVLDAPPRNRLVFGTDRPLYLSTHAPPARLLDGAGGALVATMRYHRPGAAVPDPASTRAELDRHLEVSGITRDAIRAERYLHHLTVAGSVPTAEAGGLAGRPAVVVPDRPGVAIAGDWVGPEGMLADASVASGVAAGRHAAATALDARAASKAPAPR